MLNNTVFLIPCVTVFHVCLCILQVAFYCWPPPLLMWDGRPLVITHTVLVTASFWGKPPSAPQRELSAGISTSSVYLPPLVEWFPKPTRCGWKAICSSVSCLGSPPCPSVLPSPHSAHMPCGPPPALDAGLARRQAAQRQRARFSLCLLQ